MITGDMIREAEANTEWHRSQIQGFYYPADVPRHVVRDLTRRPSEQELWSSDATDYDAAHAEIMGEIERVRANILADEINALAKL